MKLTERHLKAWQRFSDDLRAFALETEGNEDAEVTLYEDAYTTRQVCNFWMTKGGLLTWDEEGKRQYEDMMYGEDDAREWLAFWRANLRRAKRYWAMDVERLDAIQDGQLNDEED